MRDRISTPIPKSRRDNKLIRKKAKKALKSIGDTRGRRVLSFIAFAEDDPTTGEIAAETFVGNISDALKNIKGALKKVGLYSNCYLPDPLIQNQFGPSLAHRWYIDLIDDPAWKKKLAEEEAKEANHG